MSSTYPKEELSEVIARINASLVSISQNNKNDTVICGDLFRIYLDLSKASSLFANARQLKRMRIVSSEIKILQSLTGSIIHWSKLKDWKTVCNFSDDIPTEINEETENLILTMKQKDGSKVKNKKVKLPEELPEEKAIREEREQLAALKEKVMLHKAERDAAGLNNLEGVVQTEESKRGFLPAIFGRNK